MSEKKINKYCVILFPSTNYAIWAEKAFTKHQISSKMIPVPRNLSSDCGMCVRIDIKEKSRSVEIMDKTGIEYEGISEIEG